MWDMRDVWPVSTKSFPSTHSFNPEGLNGNSTLTWLGNSPRMRQIRTASLARRGSKRSQGRLDVRLIAKLKTHLGTRTAILENISKNGAMLELAVAPRVGSEVVLQWDQHEVLGKVAWVSDNHCGVTLYETLTEHVLRATLEKRGRPPS